MSDKPVQGQVKRFHVRRLESSQGIPEITRTTRLTIEPLSRLSDLDILYTIYYPSYFGI